MRVLRRFPRPSRAMAVALLAVFLNLAGIGYASTGGNFILGQPNQATSQTALTASASGAALAVSNTTAGQPAASFTVNGTAPPFTVSSNALIPNLNASQLGGLPKGSFQLSADVRGIPATVMLPGESHTWKLGSMKLTGNCLPPNGSLIEFDQGFTNTGKGTANLPVSFIEQIQNNGTIQHFSWVTAFQFAPGTGYPSVSYEVATTGGSDEKMNNITWDDPSGTITGTYYAAVAAGKCTIQGAFHRVP
jgi:hypothetical protein